MMWTGFDELLFLHTGITVAGVRVVDTGLVAYFPPEHMVTEETADGMKYNYGPVKNTAAADTTDVILEVSFAVAENATIGAVSLGGVQTVGGVSFGPLTFEVVTNVRPSFLTMAPSAANHSHFRRIPSIQW